HPAVARVKQRMCLTKLSEIDREQTKTPVYVMVFDLLNIDGASLLRTPYEQRRQRLAEAVSQGDHIVVPGALEGTLDEAIASSQELDLEGVMAKQRQSVYQPGRRSRTWLKLKHASTRDALIVGWRTGTCERSDTFGSLLLAAHGDNGLVYLGRVGTGFNHQQLQSLRSKLDQLSRKTP